MEPCKVQKLKLLKIQLEWVYGFVYVREHVFVLLETSEYSGLAYRLDGHLSVWLLLYKHFGRSIQRNCSPIRNKCLYIPFKLSFCEWLLSFLGFISFGGDLKSSDSVLLIHVFSVFWDWHSILVALPFDLILTDCFFEGVFLIRFFK